MPKPVCVPCEIELMPKKNGIIVEENREFDLPYKIWEADLWVCPKCGHEIIYGFGHNAVAEYYMTEKYENCLPQVTHHIRERI